MLYRAATHLVFGEDVVDKGAVVRFTVVDALYEIKVRVNYVASTVDGYNGKDGEDKCEQVEVVDSWRSIGER